MTTADHIAALAERAQAAVATITPDPIAWATSRGLHVNLTIDSFCLQLNVHGLNMSMQDTADLLRTTFPEMEQTQEIYGKTHWISAYTTTDDLRVLLNVFVRADA